MAEVSIGLLGVAAVLGFVDLFLTSRNEANTMYFTLVLCSLLVFAIDAVEIQVLEVGFAFVEVALVWTVARSAYRRVQRRRAGASDE